MLLVGCLACGGASSGGFCGALVDAQEAVHEVAGGSLIEGKRRLEDSLDALRAASAAVGDDAERQGAKQATQVYVDAFLALDQPDGFEEFRFRAVGIPESLAAIEGAPSC